MKRMNAPGSGWKGIVLSALLITLWAAPLGWTKEQERQQEEKEAPDRQENIWEEESPADLFRPDIDPERRFENLLHRIEEENPKRAEELRKLREENPEKFLQEIQAEFARRFQRPGLDQPPDPAQPGFGPMGPGSRAPGQRPPDVPESSRFGGRGRWEEHLKQRLEEFMLWLEKNNPELALELSALREKEPAEFGKQVLEARRRYEPILRAEKENPELGEVLMEDMALQKEQDELLHDLRGAAGEKRDKILKKLETLVAGRFDLIIRKKTLQYEELEKRLRKLQEELEKRRIEVDKLQGQKDQAVQEHMKELTTEAEKIRWD